MKRISHIHLQVSASNKAVLQFLLCSLRAAHWLHWTSHWQVKGKSFYGDHTLLDRIYNSLIEEIDSLAEKLVAEFGSESVDPAPQAQMMANKLIPIVEAKSMRDPILRALFVEESLQKIFKISYEVLKQRGFLSLGMDDYIMSIANAHETNLYLLRQRTESPMSKKAFNKENPTELINQLIKVLRKNAMNELVDYLYKNKIPQKVNQGWRERKKTPIHSDPFQKYFDENEDKNKMKDPFKY